ncbi:TPA: VENN motif pre-toxin domain-containing protein, partial [Raoultella planticola]
GHDSSTTHAAISEGDIIVRDKDRQQQDVANLSRDVEHANQTLSPIFDKEKEQQRLQQTQLIGEIGNQVADIARTQGEINGLEKAKAALGPLKENATEKERTAYIDALRNSDVYKAEMAKYGTGSAVQQGLQAATAAIQGLSGGDIAKAIAGGAAPYIAEVIKQTAPDEASRIMAHAAVAGVIAAVQGNSAAAGAAGAATTALMGEAIKKTLYGDIPVNQLSEDQKQTLVTLGTLAAGLAGGLASDSSASAMAGAQAGQNEISNNMASIGMLQQMMAQETLNAAAMAEAGKGTANDQAALALTKKVKEGLSASCLANDVCVLMAVVAAQSQQHADSSGSRTETLPVHDDLTGGKLVNPIQDENKGTSLITPDQSDSNSSIITISPETQPGKNDGIFINPRPVESTGTSYISESSNKNTSISAGDFFKGTTYTDKVKQQASSGDFHSFPESVDGHAHQGTISIITGGDGVERLKLEISGSYRGREGIFEYIREPNGTINHRLFVPKK